MAYIIYQQYKPLVYAGALVYFFLKFRKIKKKSKGGLKKIEIILKDNINALYGIKKELKQMRILCNRAIIASQTTEKEKDAIDNMIEQNYDVPITHSKSSIIK